MKPRKTVVIDPEYLRSLLDTLYQAGYRGMTNTELWARFVSSAEGGNSEAAYKFQYHMDEICAAGLLRNSDTKEGCWGAVGTDDGLILVKSTLLLTPVGSAFLEELQKPRGLEKLKEWIRAAGMHAGSQAFQEAVKEVLQNQNWGG